jgi:hypothetical protein
MNSTKQNFEDMLSFIKNNLNYFNATLNCSRTSKNSTSKNTRWILLELFLQRALVDLFRKRTFIDFLVFLC